MKYLMFWGSPSARHMALSTTLLLSMIWKGRSTPQTQTIQGTCPQVCRPQPAMMACAVPYRLVHGGVCSGWPTFWEQAGLGSMRAVQGMQLLHR